MAEDRIDSIFNITALTTEQQQAAALVKETLDLVKQARGQTIDLSVNAKSVSDAEKQYKKLVQTLAQMQGATDKAVKNSIQLSKAKEAEAKAATAAARAADAETKAKMTSAAASEKVEKATRASAKARADEQKLMDQAIDDYFQLSKAYNEAALRAKNYVLRLGEAHPIAVEAIKDANDLGTMLKKLDASVGQNQRNVGNYKSAFDGLGFSFTQVARELPSLSISVQQFALAISNNLPMVVDELAKTKKELAAMRAEGQQTPSLFSKIAKSMLSWQVGISVGIALLTAFSGAIVKWIGNMFGFNDITERSTKNIERINQKMEDGRRAADDFADSLQYLNQLGRINLEIDFPKNFELMDLQAQVISIREQGVRLAAEWKALLDENSQLSEDYYIKQIINEEAYNKSKEDIAKRRGEVEKAILKNSQEETLNYRMQQLQRVKDAKEKTEKLKDLAEQERKAAYELFKFNQLLLIQEQKDIQLRTEGAPRVAARQRQFELEAELIDKTRKFELGSKDLTRSKIKLIEAEAAEDLKKIMFERNETIRYYDSQRETDRLNQAKKQGEELAELGRQQDEKYKQDRIDGQIDELSRSFQARQRIILDNAATEQVLLAEQYKKGLLSKKEYETAKLAIEKKSIADSLQLELDFYEKLIVLADLPVDLQKEANEKIYELRRKLKGLLIKEDESEGEDRKKKQKEINDALIDLSTESFNAITDIFTNAIERRKNAIQEQINLIEDQKKKDIEFTNQTVTNAAERADKIAVIEANAAAKRQELERKQKELDQQKARFDKARSVAQIIANTAQGVTAALASIPPNPVLAAIVGAIGAVQLARVLAQPIPKYAEGTDRHPGGLMWVGDGGRSEGVIFPDGSVVKTPATDTLMYGPPGTKVIKDYATMTGPPSYSVATVDTTDELRRGFVSVVNAVKKIPQPIIHAEKAWVVAHKQGNSFRNYLNRSI